MELFANVMETPEEGLLLEELRLRKLNISESSISYTMKQNKSTVIGHENPIEPGGIYYNVKTDVLWSYGDISDRRDPVKLGWTINITNASKYNYYLRYYKKKED